MRPLKHLRQFWTLQVSFLVWQSIIPVQLQAAPVKDFRGEEHHPAPGNWLISMAACVTLSLFTWFEISKDMVISYTWKIIQNAGLFNLARQVLNLAMWRASQWNILDFTIFNLFKANSIDVVITPSPYSILLEKPMEEASGKYFAGQEISPIAKPLKITCASSWLSKTKLSELPEKLIDVSTFLL